MWGEWPHIRRVFNYINLLANKKAGPLDPLFTLLPSFVILVFNHRPDMETLHNFSARRHDFFDEISSSKQAGL